MKIAQDIATWHLYFNKQRDFDGKLVAFATPKNFENLLLFIQHPNLHRVPSTSMENINALTTVMFTIFDEYSENEMEQRSLMSDVQTRMTVIFAELANTKKSFERYFEGEQRNLALIFNTSETQLEYMKNTSETQLEYMKETKEVLFNAVQKNRLTILSAVHENRKVLGSAIQESTKVINNNLKSIGEKSLFSLLQLAEQSASHFGNQEEVLRKRVKNRRKKVKYSKIRVEHLEGELNAKTANLRSTMATIKHELQMESIAQAAKAAFELGMACLTFGLAGDPTDALEKVELIGKLIRIITQLSLMIHDLRTNLLASDTFRNGLTFGNGKKAKVPTDFLESLKRAYAMKDAGLKFDRVKSEGTAMYNKLLKNTDFVDAGKLKVAIDALVDTGKALVEETQLYSDYLLSAIEAEDQLEAAQKDVQTGAETVSHIKNSYYDIQSGLQVASKISYGDVDYRDKIDTLLSSKSTSASDYPTGSIVDFRNEILASLQKHRSEHEAQEREESNKFYRLIEALNQRSHQIQMESITKRLMLIDLFNDFCDAKMYMTFHSCGNHAVPAFNDTSEVIKTKINEMNLDAIRSKIDKKPNLVQTLQFKAKDAYSPNPLEVFKSTNSVSVNLMDFVDSLTVNRFTRIRVSSIAITLVDVVGEPILSEEKVVRFLIRFPNKFTDLDSTRVPYEFIKERFECYSEYENKVQCKYKLIMLL